MFLVLALILLLAWAFGAFAFHAAGGIIHLLLVIAVVSVLVHFARGTRART